MDCWRSWAAGVLLVCADTDEVLLGRDAAKGGEWSDFAGGGEAEDATPRETALRELREETSGAVTLTSDDLNDALLVFRDTTPRGKIITRYVVSVPRFSPSGFVPNDEKTALRWWPLRALPKMRGVFGVQMRRDLPKVLAALARHRRSKL